MCEPELEARNGLMSFWWHDYKQSGDKMCLVGAIKSADFFGHPQIAEEVAKLLIEAFDLKGMGTENHRRDALLPLMFAVETRKPEMTKQKAYEKLGLCFRMTPEAVRMRLKRLHAKRANESPTLTPASL